MISYDVPTHAPLLTPRQDRLERAITEALLTRSTRSELRSIVHQLVDLFRLQGISRGDGVMRIRVLAVHTTAAMGPVDARDELTGDGPADRLAMVVQWATQRYGRDD